MERLSPYNPAIILLGIYPDELRYFVHTKPCTLMFIAALFIVQNLEATKWFFNR